MMATSRIAFGARTERVTNTAPAIRTWPAAPVTILLVALVIPWVFSFGSLAVSVYRLVLVALIVPSLVFWLSGKAGRIRAVDVLLCLFCMWGALATGLAHGATEAIEPSGVLFLETFGAYLVARCYVRTSQDLAAATRLLLLIVCLLLPLALVETFTQQKATLDLFRLVMPSIEETSNDPRWGLTRVQGPFEHPILFGVFCSAAVALTALVLGRHVNPAQRWTMTAVVAMTSMTSLSSGPMAALFAQLGLLAWNGLFRNVAARWRILWGIGIVLYLIAEVSSNQSVAQMLTRFAFDPWTAFYRLLIFEYGWASVLAHPVFGVGFNEWLRPLWMSASIDMFWLVPAVRYGLPGGMLFMLAFFTAMIGTAGKSLADDELVNCRTGYLISMAGFFLVGWTVHFWTATYVLFMFLLGSGMWLLDADGEANNTGVHSPARLRRRKPTLGRRQAPSDIARIDRNKLRRVH